LQGAPGDEAPGWNPRAEALLFAAARSDHVERLIRPALVRGCWVVCDRFLDSSRAYQGGGGGLSDEDIRTLHAIGSANGDGGLLPDLTVLVEVTPDVAAARLALRDGDGTDLIAGRGTAYHARVAQAFARFAEAEPARFTRIDGNAGADATHAAILAALAPMLAATGG
jgi:dTMP kinase